MKLRTLLQRYKIHLVVLFSILAGIIFIVYSFVSPHGFLYGLSPELKKINPEPAFAYTRLDGTPVSLDMYKGKPLVINSWASWMPFSKDELHLLSDAKDTYGDQIEILAINRKEEIPMIRAFMSAFQIEEDITLLVDPTDHFYKAIGGQAMPETVFYTSEGVVSLHKRGVLTDEELRGTIDTLLQK